MPPPARPEIQGPDESGEVTLRGRVDARSEVYAENMRTGAIRGQHTADGAYRIVIGAEVGDRMQLFYRHMGDYSPTLEFLIPKPEPRPDAGSLSAPK